MAWFGETNPDEIGDMGMIVLPFEPAVGGADGVVGVGMVNEGVVGIERVLFSTSIAQCE